MYNYTDEIRQDRTKCYHFFYTMEELLEYFEEIKKKKTRT